MPQVDSFINFDRVFRKDVVPSVDFKPFVVVITRFAMATGFASSSRAQDPEPLRQWMMRRLPLFERTCLPAMYNQEFKPDLWMVGVRSELMKDLESEPFTQLPFVRLVAQYPLDEGPCEHPEHFNSAINVFGTAIASELPTDATHVLTIRLDNDDIIHPYYVAVIRRYAEFVAADSIDISDHVLSMAFGLQRNQKEYSPILYPNGPFQSRLEKVGSTPFLTAYDGNHIHLFNQKSVHIIMTKVPMWIQVMHGENVSNSIKRNAIRFPSAGNIPVSFKCDEF